MSDDELQRAVVDMICDLECWINPENLYVGREEYHKIMGSDYVHKTQDGVKFCGLNVFFINADSHLKVA